MVTRILCRHGDNCRHADIGWPCHGALRVEWLYFSYTLERGAEFFREKLRLFPGREVPALVDLVEIDEVAIGALGPALRRTVDLAGNTVTATGSEISAVFCTEALVLLLLSFSQ
jgi:hypothetical protein